MAEIAIAAAALPQRLIEFFVINPRKIAEWWDLHKSQPKDIRQLLVEIKNVSTHLSDLEKWVSEHVAEPHRGVIEFSTSSLQQELSPLGADCVEVQKISSKGLFNVFRSVPQKRLKSIQSHLSVIRTNLSSLANTLTSLPTNPTFVVVRNTIPSEPHALYFNFKKKDDGTFETSEGELYDAILNSSPSGPNVIVARGLAGIGKTCAVQEIGRRVQENSEKFKDGVLYISMGQGASVLELIEKLAELVKITGGSEKEVQSIRETKSVAIVVRLTGIWFKDRCCLFLFDDVWCTNGIVSSIISDLVGITNHKGSKLVFTTRDERLFMDKSKNITFGMKKDSDSQQILLLRSSLALPESNNGKAMFSEILQNCAGLPIALSLAGAWIRQKKGESGNGAWRLYLSSGFGSVLDGSDEWMKKSVVSSLRLAHEETDGPNQFNFETLFLSFSIIREQQSVPIRIFERLWKLSKKQTLKIMRSLERFSVVEIMYMWNGQNTLCVSLHDRILEVARTFCDEQTSDEPRPSRTLIDSYTNDTVSHTGPASSWLEQFQKNWRSVFDDEFISKNLFRLLADSGQNDAAVWLTQEPAWIIKQLSKNGVLQVLKDFRIVEKYLQSDLCRMDRDEKHSNRNLLSLVREICVLISNLDWESVWNGYPWFQLYGRMRSYWNESLVDTFLKKVERDCPRPWLKPDLGLLPVAGTMLQTMISLDGQPLFQVEDNGNLVVVYTSSDGGCKLARYDSLGDLIFDVVLEENLGIGYSETVECATYSLSIGAVTLGMRGGEVKIWRLSNAKDISCKDNRSGPKHNSNRNSTGGQEGSKIRKDLQLRNWESTVLRGHEDWVSSVAMSRDGTRVVSGSYDKTVRVWDAGKKGWESTVLRGHEGWVWNVVVSGDNARVVSGSVDGTVRVWDAVEKGWESNVLKGHEDGVWSVAISGDGERLVSGSDDETVRVWNLGKKGWESNVLWGHSGHVRSVAMSTDGTRVVSGSYDKTVRVWEAKEDWESNIIRGHVGNVKSVVISTDGARVVSGSDDKTVRVWEAGEKGWDSNNYWTNSDDVKSVAISADGARVVSASGEDLRVWDGGENGWERRVLWGHNGTVNSVAISTDGERIVSGSDDRAVRVWTWDAEENEWESSVLGGHEDWVNSVAISADGKRVVSGSRDETVRMWQWQGTEWKGKVLGKFDSEVKEVNISHDSGEITGCLWNDELLHWKDDSERWVEGGSDASENSDTSWRSGFLTKSQLEMICDASDVYETSSGFCVTLNRLPFIGFVEWVK